jgi:hypothetical protein
MHTTAQRLRLRYHKELPDPQRDRLLADLARQSWVASLAHRLPSRSIVIGLIPDCPEVRWTLALAASGWQLEDPPGALSPLPPDAPGWSQVMRQVGGNMMGAVAGQLLFGGIGGALGAWWFGARGALVLGASGALVGGVAGAVVGGELADGESPLRKGDVGDRTVERLRIRLGEEAGSSTGVLIGTAVAGPVGALAGMALGSMLGGQLSHDLLTTHKGAGPAIGSPLWFASMGAQSSGEAVSEAALARLGRALSGGSEAGARIGAGIGLRFARKVNWTAPLPALEKRLHLHPALNIQEQGADRHDGIEGEEKGSLVPT